MVFVELDAGAAGGVSGGADCFGAAFKIFINLCIRRSRPSKANVNKIVGTCKSSSPNSRFTTEDRHRFDCTLIKADIDVHYAAGNYHVSFWVNILGGVYMKTWKSNSLYATGYNNIR